jgi:hypothetical protein
MYNCLAYHIAEISPILKILEKKQVEKFLNIKICVEKESLASSLQKRFRSAEILLSEEFTKSQSNYNESIYLNKDIINLINKNLDNILHIFSRYFIVNKFISYGQIKQHIYSLTCQSLNLIKKNNVDLIIFYQTPHHVDSYITYLISKLMNIKTIIIRQFSFFDEHRLCIDKNLDIFFSDLNNVVSYEKKSLLKTKNYLERFSSEKIQNAPYLKDLYIKNIKFLNKNNILYYLYLDMRNHLFGSNKYLNGFYYWYEHDYFSRNKPISNIKFVIKNFLLRLKILKLKKHYNKITENKFTRKFVVFFPNYQPEASTMPEADIYADIYLILNNLFSKLPKDFKVIYKEHKTTFDYSRESFVLKNPMFYNYLKKKFKNLIFYDYDSDKNNLIKNSQFVITMTSNVAWEALLQKKKVVIAKGVWFDRFNCFIKIDELDKKINYLLSSDEPNDEYVGQFIEYCSNIETNSFSKFNFLSEDEKKIEKLFLNKLNS